MPDQIKNIDVLDMFTLRWLIAVRQLRIVSVLAAELFLNIK